MFKESLHLRLNRGVGLIGGHTCSSVLCGSGIELVFVDLEARHHLVDNGVGVVEDKFINSTSCFSEFKLIFAEVMFEFVPRFVRLDCALPCPYVILEDPFPV